MQTVIAQRPAPNPFLAAASRFAAAMRSTLARAHWGDDNAYAGLKLTDSVERELAQREFARRWR